MLEVFKYQLKGRKNAILLLLAIFGVLNIVAFGLELTGLASVQRGGNGLGFWLVITFMTTVISTVVMFFLCGTGHVHELLWRDTSYLMLTVPRKGWEILAGRLLAGIVEFIVYFSVGGFLLSIHGAILTSREIGNTEALRSISFGSGFPMLYKFIFIDNIVTTIQATVFCIAWFAIVGIFITFAAIAARSMVRNKAFATVGTITLVVILTSLATKWGEAISQRFNWYWTIHPNPPSYPLFGIDLETTATTIPLAPVVLFLVLAAVLFCAAAWLLERKVEV
jgi:hypothetical protein